MFRKLNGDLIRKAFEPGVELAPRPGVEPQPPVECLVAEFLADLDKGEAVARSILANPRIDLIGEAPWRI